MRKRQSLKDLMEDPSPQLDLLPELPELSNPELFKTPELLPAPEVPELDLVDETPEFVTVVTSDAPHLSDQEKKNPHAVALGRRGGLKGGPARAQRLTVEQRREIARKAAQARWSRPPG